MRPPRPFALVRTEDQWRRAAHENTALIGEVVQLAWMEEETVDAEGEPPPAGAGLAFDEHCRLYHSVPEEGRVERILWAASQPAEPLDLFEADPVASLGDFRPVSGAGQPLQEPRGLAVDENERLYIAEAGAQRVLVFDLWSRRLLEQVRLPGRPVDLAIAGPSVVALVESPPLLFDVGSRTLPRQLAMPGVVSAPARLAASPSGELFVLDRAGTAQARVVAAGRVPLLVPRATDIEFQSDDVLVVSRSANEDFRRFRIGAAAIDEISALKPRLYDGRGIVRTPDGRIGFWTVNGFRHAVGARVRYRPEGRVTTFRLDSGEFNTTWGRLFLDACIPKDTRIRIHCVATDEPPEEGTLSRTPPANTLTMEVVRPDLSPPMPPLSLVPEPQEITQTVHRRESGRELPWSPMAEGDPFETYEAPILTGPGRYLWLTVQLTGNSLSTPRVRALRAEYPTHDLLRRIPKIYSRDPKVASFLIRYLAMFEGFLGELEGESETRHSLIDARSARAELLPWLGGFAGLVMDERWPECVRRKLLEEITWLFRFRGTVPGLMRFLEIYLGREVILIEKFRVRGLGDALIGEKSGLQGNAILGAGFRIGGAVGEQDVQTLNASVDDAFETHAHRFAVVIPAALTEEQMAVVQHILDVHRPAHTLVEVCTVGAGMRVGRGLHVELTSIVGRTGGWRTLQLDSTLLGRGGIVGKPAPGLIPGASRLDKDSRVG